MNTSGKSETTCAAPTAAKYLVCYNAILAYMREHDLNAGDKLPTEQRFTEILGVSRITVRRAIAELEAKGYITKVQGKGTFVAQPPSAEVFQTEIPLVIPGSSSGTVYSLLQGASEYLEDHAYHLRSCFVQGGPEDERTIVEKLVAEGYHCIMIFPIDDKENHEFFFEMEQKGIHFVFMDRESPYLSGSSVRCDNVRGGYLATEHLISQGYSRIAYLSRTPESEVYALTQRLSGYRFALEKHGLSYDDRLVCFVPQGGDFGQELSQLMRLSPDSIVCANDLTAVDVLCRIDQLLPPGADSPAVIGFDNSSILNDLPFSLSTIEQSFYNIGYQAAQIACDTLTNGFRYSVHKVLPVRLIVRDSTPKKKGI